MCPRRPSAKRGSFVGPHLRTTESAGKVCSVWRRALRMIHEGAPTENSLWSGIDGAAGWQAVASVARRALGNGEQRDGESAFEGQCVYPRRHSNEPVKDYWRPSDPS